MMCFSCIPSILGTLRMAVVLVSTFPKNNFSITKNYLILGQFCRNMHSNLLEEVVHKASCPNN